MRTVILTGAGGGDGVQRTVTCSDCRTEMEDLGYKNLREGGSAGFGGMLLGGLNQLAENLLPIHVYRCPSCRKLAFYDAD